MGCLLSTENEAPKESRRAETRVGATRGGRSKDRRTTEWSRPRWMSEEPVNEEKIKKMREEFWDTQPHYGGCREIWDALKAACEVPDLETSKLIMESAGIIVAAPDMTICYDERGAKYELPKYVISYPTNMEKS